MVAGEAEACQESNKVIAVESFLGKLSEDAIQQYPKVWQRFLLLSDGATQWLELVPDVLRSDPILGPTTVVRMLISSNRSYQIQILFPFIRIFTRGLIDTDSSFKAAIAKILPQSGYVLCPGFPLDGYRDRHSVIRFHMKGVHVISEPVERYESENCLLWHIPTNKKSKIGHPLHNVCDNCKKVYSHVTQLAESAVQTDVEVKCARTACSSNYSWSKLSPSSQQKRRSQLVRERQIYIKKASTVFEHTGVPLDDEQGNQLATVISTIEGSTKAKSTLDGIFSEANNSRDGNGDILRHMWEKEKERAAFFKDQRKNRTACKVNRWSLITYRLALAVFSRSPAAFESIRQLDILKLPSASSLRPYLSAHQHNPGANEEYLELQHKLYTQHTEEAVKRGQMKPTKDGILIFDEVRVQSGVVWNSKNNQILGVAMSSDELPSLHDIYSVLDENEKVKATRYVLQFIWRDLSSKFDIVGPYYTSEGGFDAQFTLACVHDAMFHLAAFDFQVLGLIGDGASWNHSLFKHLCGHKGKFRCDAVEDGDKHDVPAFFTSPFTGDRVSCIICPSHELKSLVSALYHSSNGQVKHFFKDGTLFGWDTLRRLWQRELSRSEKGEMMNIPRLRSSYIYRDSWTRLSVTPAKIMQQEKVIAEIRTYTQQRDPHLGTTKYDCATLEFLIALSKIFEKGLLSHEKVTDGDATALTNMTEGLQYFEEWCDEAILNGVDVSDDQQNVFIAWQTWDLLRMTIKGFLGLCENFLMRNPGYYIQPVRVNGSVAESLFSRFKYHANGHLSAVNYRGSVAKLMISDAIKGKEDYRCEKFELRDVLTKKTYKRSK